MKTYIREKEMEDLCIVYAFGMAWNVMRGVEGRVSVNGVVSWDEAEAD
ncbi:hypothetical protein [Bartonella grahamii]|nr:hypothetical protein [Bartonella grahamii]